MASAFLSSDAATFLLDDCSASSRVLWLSSSRSYVLLNFSSSMDAQSAALRSAFRISLMFDHT